MSCSLCAVTAVVGPLAQRGAASLVDVSIVLIVKGISS